MGFKRPKSMSLVGGGYAPLTHTPGAFKWPVYPTPWWARVLCLLRLLHFWLFRVFFFFFFFSTTKWHLWTVYDFNMWKEWVSWSLLVKYSTLQFMGSKKEDIISTDIICVIINVPFLVAGNTRVCGLCGQGSSQRKR